MEVTPGWYLVLSALLFTLGLVKLRQQILHCQVFFFCSPQIEQNPTLVQHNQAVTETDGMLHVVGDHQSCQLLAGHYLLGKM